MFDVQAHLGKSIQDENSKRECQCVDLNKGRQTGMLDTSKQQAVYT